MKPLLRAVLVINALIFLAFGVLFLLTPWTALWASMHLVTVQPPFVGQLFGVALIGIAWLAVHASIDGALTARAAEPAPVTALPNPPRPDPPMSPPSYPARCPAGRPAPTPADCRNLA